MSAVNLLSDAQTRPTAAIRRAIAEAEVGDEQKVAENHEHARILAEGLAGLRGVSIDAGTVETDIRGDGGNAGHRPSSPGC